ncbi:MAG: hypothetical protein AB7S38_32970 [Vulcanimicrobiota bacterium]
MTRKLAALILVATLLGMAEAAAGVRLVSAQLRQPWTGSYYGQGQRLWGRAVVRNGANHESPDLRVRFDFYDSEGVRRSFDLSCPSLAAHSTVVVVSPQWWDYSEANLKLRVSVYAAGSGRPLDIGVAER